MTAGSMVTSPAPPHTVAYIRQSQASGHPGSVAAHHRRTDMQQDTRADSALADPQSSSTDICDDLQDLGKDPGITEELLVEEISIDGMCGVY